jgi:hypothetical protein
MENEDPRDHEDSTATTYMRVGFSTAGFRRGSVIFSTLPSMDAALIMTN